jgi:hypothetical protein
VRLLLRDRRAAGGGVRLDEVEGHVRIASAGDTACGGDAEIGCVPLRRFDSGKRAAQAIRDDAQSDVEGLAIFDEIPGRQRLTRG